MSGLFGQIHSPNFPERYPDNLKCNWSISVPGMLLLFAFAFYVLIEITRFILAWLIGVCIDLNFWYRTINSRAVYFVFILLSVMPPFYVADVVCAVYTGREISARASICTWALFCASDCS